MHEASWVSVALGMANANQANVKNSNAFLALNPKVKSAIAVFLTATAEVMNAKNTDV